MEDNPANLELMSYLLSRHGHTVLAAGDGQQGLEMVRRENPDLIVCDLQLPYMDGFEFACWLKSHPVLRRIPLVAVSSFAMVGDRDRVLAAGFDGYLAKPIQPETFVQQVEAFLPLEKHSAAIFPSTTEVSAPESAAHTPGPTILVVDNLPLNIELARCILEPSGYRVVTATSMAEGLRMSRETLCDLILSDVFMGGGSGYEFLGAIRSDPQFKDIPFVLITSTTIGDGDRKKGLALGAERFLRRPIEPEALLAEIQACLAKKGRIEHGKDLNCR